MCEEWRQRLHTNDGLEPVIKINGYTIKRSNYDIFIVFSLGNKDQPLRSFTPVEIIRCRRFEFLKDHVIR